MNARLAMGANASRSVSFAKKISVPAPAKVEFGQEDLDALLFRAMDNLDKLDALVKSRAHPEDMVPLLTDLASTSLHVDLHVQIAQASLDLMISILRLHYEHERVATPIVMALCNLSYTDETLAAILSRDFLKALQRCMQFHLKSTKLQAASVKFLVNCSCTPGYRPALISSNLLDTVIHTMQDNPSAAGVHKEAMRFFININFEPHAKVNMPNFGLLRPIQESMITNKSAPMQVEALRCLYNLTYQNAPLKEEAYEIGLINTIAASMIMFSDQDNLLLYGFQVLSNLAIAGEKYRAAIRAAGVAGIAAQAKKISNAKLYVKAVEVEDLMCGKMGVAGQAKGDMVREVGLSAEGGGDVRKRTVPIGYFVKSLEQRSRSSGQLADLLLYIPFLIMFFFFFKGNQVAGEQSYYAVQSMSEQILGTEMTGPKILKTYVDINNIDDWWMWYKTVLLEVVLWPPGQTDGGNGRFAVGNIMLLGSARTRLINIRTDSCAINPYIYPEGTNTTPGAIPCYDRFKDGRQNMTAKLDDELVWRTCEETQEQSLTSDQVYPCSGHVMDVPFNNTLEQAVAKAEILQKHVSNDITRLVLSEFFTYIPPFDCFASFKCINEVKSGGVWVNRYQFRLFRIWTKEDMSQSVFDLVFFAYVLVYIVRYIQQAHQESKVYNQSPLRYFMNVWNILEFVNLTCFVIVGVIKVLWVFESLKFRNSGVRVLDPGGYPSAFEKILFYYSWTIYVNAANCIFTFVKLLKYLQMNDNFNILTRTVKKAAQPCIGMALVWAIIMVSFSVCGNLIFGLGLEDFRNMNTTFSTLSRFLVGDFDYEAMREENRWLAGLYFWAFAILCIFMILNFLIAIFTDAFGEVAAESANTSFEVQVDNLMKSTAFSLQGSMMIQRLQLLYYRTSMSRILEKVLHKCILPYRSRIRARTNWQKLRHYVKCVRPLEKKDGHTTAMGQAIAGSLTDSDKSEVDYTLVTRNEIRNLIPPELYVFMGDIYFDSLWAEVLLYYAASLEQPQELDNATATQQIITVTREVSADLQTSLGVAVRGWNLLIERTKLLRKMIPKTRKARSQRSANLSRTGMSPPPA